MVNQDIDYPIFRKYDNNRSFFKVVSPTQFIEIQVMGSTYFRYEMNAKILPDFHLINDMISKHNGHWISCTEIEFTKVHDAYEMSKSKTKDVI